jgi:hypothetical protein
MMNWVALVLIALGLAIDVRSLVCYLRENCGRTTPSGIPGLALSLYFIAVALASGPISTSKALDVYVFAALHTLFHLVIPVAHKRWLLSRRKDS